jgi:hypothetical protein
MPATRLLPRLKTTAAPVAADVAPAVRPVGLAAVGAGWAGAVASGFLGGTGLSTAIKIGRQQFTAGCAHT